MKAILFDMDGVLIDARDWHYEALNLALEKFGHSISRESHLTTFDGLPTRKKLEILSKSTNLPTGLHETINSLKQKYTMQISYTKCAPTFKHQRALSSLKNLGYKIGVCSNSIRQTVLTLMELSALSPYIDLVYSSEDVINSKPSPEMYIKAMNELGVTPQETLIVEDSPFGIQAANQSNAHVLKVNDPMNVSLDNILTAIGGC